MHTVDLLEQALALASSLGIRVRQDWLGGSGGGCCEIRGERWLFVDLALAPAEQFSQVAAAIIAEGALVARPAESSPSRDIPRTGDQVVSIPISSELSRALELRKSA